ncbi:MAG: DUF4433 domain-containing protein [Candidatus Chloroheliales bacterium]|nr:MAG: DUF4433 domain-containing protein [Chloroflexota bacterium]
MFADQPCAEPGCHVTHIYHITHIDNLPSILLTSGLDAKSVTGKGGTGYTDIAHQNIQDRRARVSVPKPPFGTLHDYVPFYFAPRAPMLYAIHKGAVVGYSGGQNEIVYLVSTVNAVATNGTPFVFTDGHAIMAYTNFYTDTSDLARLNWEILRARYWQDRAPGDDRKRRRQAEFLVYQHFAWELTERIAVPSREIGEKVEGILAAVSHRPAVTLRRDWYY